VPATDAPRLTSERLVLRAWTDDDRRPLEELCADPVVMAHFPAPLTPAGTSDLLARSDRAWADDGFGLWAVELLPTAPTGPVACVGTVGLARADWLAPGTVEVLWRLAAAHWGHGYAPEAATVALAFAFLQLGLDEVVALTVPANTQSLRVMEKVGMVHDPARDVDHPRVDPAAHPHLVRHVVWSVTRDDWLALHADHV
jgi:RimJ/RimL family protein N-acetyltransferase